MRQNQAIIRNSLICYSHTSFNITQTTNSSLRLVVYIPLLDYWWRVDFAWWRDGWWRDGLLVASWLVAKLPGGEMTGYLFDWQLLRLEAFMTRCVWASSNQSQLISCRATNCQQNKKETPIEKKMLRCVSFSLQGEWWYKENPQTTHALLYLRTGAANKHRKRLVLLRWL